MAKATTASLPRKHRTDTAVRFFTLPGGHPRCKVPRQRTRVRTERVPKTLIPQSRFSGTNAKIEFTIQGLKLAAKATKAPAANRLDLESDNCS